MLVGAACASLAGCGPSEFVGTYVGRAVESSSLTVRTPAGDAKNEAPPREKLDEQVVVTAERGVLTVRFGDCTLKGRAASGGIAVLKGLCPVRTGALEQPIPMSATLSLPARNVKRPRLDVTGLLDQGSSTVRYSYEFEGDKS
jgi:hypothetical protein